MAFHEIQFPADISYGSVGGPEWKTEINQLGSGHESRNQEWEYPLFRYNVAYGIREETHVKQVYKFHLLRRGRVYGFRFKDYVDFESEEPQIIGTGDDSETQYQLVKIYADAAASLTRPIYKPVAGKTKIYFDESLQTSGWTVDTTTGLVTFSSPPGGGIVITAEYEFDVPVRFDTDHCPVTLVDKGALSTQLEVIGTRDIT